MRVYLTDNYKLTKFDLPLDSDDFFTYNYRISNSNIDCLITFEKKEDKWYLKSNGSVSVLGSGSLYSSAEVKEYINYKLKVIGYKNNLNIYFGTYGNEETKMFDTANLQKIAIGNSNQCNICYFNDEVAQTQAIIAKDNQGWFISNIEDSRYYTYIDDSRIFKKRLKAGEVIFINGLKIVWMHKFFSINNPNFKVKISGINTYIIPTIDNTKYDDVSDEDQAVKLFNEEDYFYHTPRIIEVLDDVKIKIDNPPTSNTKEEQPFWITISSSITMAMSSLMMGWNIVINMTSGNANLLRIIPQIIMCVVMVFSSLIMPKFVKSYQKKQENEKEEKRINKYTEYLNNKEKEIDIAMKKQAQILRDNSPSFSACKSLVTNIGNRNFWSREINDDDFLTINLGVGNIDNPIKLDCPQTSDFRLEEDGLLEKVIEVEKKYEKLADVPINISLIEKNISAFVCDDRIRNNYLDNIILQLVTLHSGADLKIVIFTNENNDSRWEYTKYLPHCFSEDKSMRYFASNIEQIKEVSNALEEIYKDRKQLIKSPGNNGDTEAAEKIKAEKEYKNFSTYFLIICDNYKNNLNIPIIKKILEETEKNYGFSFSIFTNTLKNLPARCDTFIQVGQKEGCILGRNISSKSQKVFRVEYEKNLDMRKISNVLLNIPLIPKEGVQVLPTSLSFLEMFKVSKIEQLNIQNRWRSNNPVMSLATPIGVYANGDEFRLNLHEKFHGPHGLIAGSTGSGKSEFIITYILSMCVNYHPYEVQFVLIDYKGGGLAGAFQNKETGVKVPHLVGTITNLDTASMNRTLVSINSELKRRQRVFNETKDKLGESTVDIYKYQKFYREGSVKEPMAHLFIISDEFAELKAQQPDFMQELISTARIGRSLGVHLILATQKPSGVVNDQIWSNSKFKVCLKVQDRGDSMEMLKRPEAASIKETGRFYLQVGYDDFFDKGQSGWAGAKYVPSDRVIKKIDDSVEFIDNIGNVTRNIKDIVVTKNDDVDLGDQLTNIVKTIYNIGIKQQLTTKGLWLDEIPEFVYIEDLKKKYNYKPTPYLITPVIGEYDLPSAQEQGLLNLNISKGNTVIYGKGGVGKENLLSTIIWSSCIEHTPQEVNFYIVDCGAESLKRFKSMPHVGDVATISEPEKMINMMGMVEEEIEKRKELMVEYGGSYNDYIENSGQKLPLMVVIINNYDIFVENFSKLSEQIQAFYRDGAKYGVMFIVSAIATNAVRAKMLQNFVNKICLQIANDTDYRTIVNSIRGQIPAKLFGRGLIQYEPTAVEFQTAIFCEKKDMSKYIMTVSKQLSDAYNYKAKEIIVMPEEVHFSDLDQDNISFSNIPVGLKIENVTSTSYNFENNKITNIVGNEMGGFEFSFAKVIFDTIYKLEDTNLCIIDFTEIFKGEYSTKENFYFENYDKAIMDINNFILSNNSSDKKNVLAIIGVGQFKSKFGPNGIAVFNNLFNKIATLENTYVIFVDSYNSLKNITTEIWYQNCIDNTSGIWLGEGVSNQMVINVNNVTMDHRKLSFPCMAFLVKKGQYEIIKHIVEEDE